MTKVNKRVSQIVGKVKQRLLDLQIRDKLILSFLFLILIPVMAISFLSFQKSKSIIQYKTEEYTKDILVEISKNIELKFQDINNLYYSIFMQENIQKALNESNSKIVAEYTRVTDFRQIETFLTEVTASRNYVESIYIYPMNDDDYFARYPSGYYEVSSEDKDTIFEAKGSAVWMKTDKERKVIPCGRVINDIQRQNPLGYIIINLKEDELFNIYKSTKLYGNGELFIVNNNGEIISHANKELLSTKQDYEYLDEVLLSAKKGFFVHKNDNRKYYITYHTIDSTSWKIVSVISAIDYENEALSLRNWVYIIASAFLLVSILISLFISSSISKPIHSLSLNMQKVEKGDFKAYSPYNAKDEVGVLSENFNKMVKRIDFLVHRVYKEQLLKQKSELDFLKFQINPHFLYNTLETINWAARIEGKDDIGKLAKALGDLMREGLKSEDFIPVSREIDNINNYLFIQKYRYGDKFDITIEIESEAMYYDIPKFILQPLVENSIVHGIEMKMDKGTIDIRGRISDDSLLLSVSDNGVGISEDRIEKIFKGKLKDEHGIAIGLSNVHRRVQLYYGEDYGVSIKSKPGEGATVTIKLPLSPF